MYLPRDKITLSVRSSIQVAAVMAPATGKNHILFNKLCGTKYVVICYASRYLLVTIMEIHVVDTVLGFLLSQVCERDGNQTEFLGDRPVLELCRNYHDSSRLSLIWMGH